jgi:hypothetical protein
VSAVKTIVVSTFIKSFVLNSSFSILFELGAIIFARHAIKKGSVGRKNANSPVTSK